VFPVFAVIWVLLGIGNAVFMLRGRNPRLKRTLFRWFNVVGCALFSVFVLVLTRRPIILLLVLPALGVISFINIRTTKFCGSCGATLYDLIWFRRTKFCTRCGASLTS
jgi:hypothetical protein